MGHPRRTMSFLLSVVTLVLAMPASARAQPTNDDVANRTVMFSGFTDQLSTAAATTEPTESQPCGGIANTVWYSYVPQWLRA